MLPTCAFRRKGEFWSPEVVIHWGRVLFTEVALVGGVIYGLGFIKMPRFLMRRKLSSRFPWGYYADQVPKTDDPGYFASGTDFLHDTGTHFGGYESFGDYGEFSGFGELGEYGSSFFGGDGSGGGGGE